MSRFNAHDIIEEQSIEREIWEAAIDYALGSASHCPGVVLSHEEILKRVYSLGMILKYGEAAFEKNSAPAPATVH